MNFLLFWRKVFKLNIMSYCMTRDYTFELTRRSALRSSAIIAATLPSGCVGESTDDGKEKQLEDETFRIGVLNFPSGPDSGWSRIAGLELAASEINAGGGIAGAEIELLVRDTSDPPRNETHFARLHRDHDLDLTIGRPPELDADEPLWPITQYETLHLTLGAWGTTTTTQLSEQYDEYKSHFRVGMPNGAELAAPFVEFVEQNAEELGWESAALFSEWPTYNDVTKSFEDALTERFPTTLERHSTVSFDAYHHFDDYFEELASDGVDVLFVSGIHNVQYIKTWAEKERPFDLGGLHLRGTYDDFWSYMDGACDGMFSLSPMGPETEHTEYTSSFMDAYAEVYTTKPPSDAAIAYDTLYIYKQAVENALRRGDDSEKPSQRALIEALLEGEFTGRTLYSTYEFRGADHEFPHEPVWESQSDSGIPVLEQWQRTDEAGKRTVISPEQHQTSAFQSVVE